MFFREFDRYVYKGDNLCMHAADSMHFMLAFFPRVFRNLHILITNSFSWTLSYQLMTLTYFQDHIDIGKVSQCCLSI